MYRLRYILLLLVSGFVHFLPFQRKSILLVRICIFVLYFFLGFGQILLFFFSLFLSFLLLHLLIVVLISPYNWNTLCLFIRSFVRRILNFLQLEMICFFFCIFYLVISPIYRIYQVTNERKLPTISIEHNTSANNRVN